MLLEIKAPFSEAGMVVIAGILIVFIGMIILTLILSLMNIIGKRKPSKKAPKEKECNVSAPVTEAVAAGVAETEGTEDDELCAVIAAAIAAYYSESGKTSTIKASEVKRICRRVNAERKNG